MDAPMIDTAFLASRVTLPDGQRSRAHAAEHDLEVAVLTPAFAAIGRRLVPVSWDNDRVGWAGFEAAIVRTTWDYARRLPEFLAAMDKIAGQTRLFNPPAILRWNADKSYLRDLADRGAPAIPTLWVDRVDRANVAAAFAQFDTEALVAKPRIGAGGWRQALLQRSAPLPAEGALPLGPALLQPFLPSVVEEGEYSFVFCGGELSHAFVKRAAEGDYRVQPSYGGREFPIEPGASDLALAREVLEALGETLLYARVDMARLPDGRLAVMELEAVEPFLYPAAGPDVGLRLADAYLRLLCRTPLPERAR